MVPVFFLDDVTFTDLLGRSTLRAQLLCVLYAELEFLERVALLLQLSRAARGLPLLLRMDGVVPQRSWVLVHLYPPGQAAVRCRARGKPWLLPIVCEVLRR